MSLIDFEYFSSKAPETLWHSSHIYTCKQNQEGKLHENSRQPTSIVRQLKWKQAIWPQPNQLSALGSHPAEWVRTPYTIYTISPLCTPLKHLSIRAIHSSRLLLLNKGHA